MPIQITPEPCSGVPTPCPDARFELLGILILASSAINDDAAIDLLPHYLDDARSVMTNSTTLMAGGTKITMSADLRAGCVTASPRLTIHGITITETVMAASLGRPVRDLIDAAWLSHSGLVIREGENEGGSSPCVRIALESAEVDIHEAIVAIRETAYLRKRDAERR